jgi:protein-S-isoprenylcysteine O-methyltransferase Ste14
VRTLLRGCVAQPPIANPGVRFPPPFLFAAGFLLGWLIHRRWPNRLFPAEWTSTAEAIGLVAIVIAFAIVGWAFATFLRHRTAIYPNQPATRIVRDGPYRWTRNPMYLSMTLMYIGLTFLVNALLPMLLLPLVLVLLVRLVIHREERYLRSAFSDEYAAYCQDVRRWL